MPNKLNLYRDKEKARKYRNRNRKRNYMIGKAYDNNSKEYWTSIEDFILTKLSETNYTDRYIAKILGRSVQSIQTRRYRLIKSMNKEET